MIRHHPPIPALFLTLLALALFMTPPASAQQKFIDRNYRVRIAVARDVTSMRLMGTGAYAIEDANGVTVAQMRAMGVYCVAITPGQPGGRSYRIVLGEYDSHQSDRALTQSGRAMSEYKLPVKVINIPAENGKPARLLVTLGLYSTLQEARDAVKNLKDPSIEFIYEQRSPAERGEVRILNSTGDVIARDPRQLNLKAYDPLNDSIHLRDTTKNPSLSSMRDTRHYRGQLRLLINNEGTLTAVNELLVEEYLYSVVPSEIGDDAPYEALKAQAVAGRSEAVAKIQRGIVSGSFYDFVDTAMAQQYKGKGSETARSNLAVDETRGEILVWPGARDGNVAVDAVYSHSCGGAICSSADMWGGDNEGYAPRRYDRLDTSKTPYFRNWAATHPFVSKSQPSFCNPNQPGFPKYARKYYRWRRHWSGRELSRMLNASYHTGRVRDVIVDKRSPSGRVDKISIAGDRRTVKLRGEQDIRDAFGGLYSTFFTFTKDQGADGYLSEITIYGAGYGHGVGMCQMGAYMMAKQGYNYRQILAHYYSKVKMRKLYR